MKRAAMLLLSLLLTMSVCACSASGEVTVPELTVTYKSVPETEAFAFTKALGVGWNLGNTFDATGGSWIKDEMDIETAWHGDRTKEALIEALRQAGFDSIRIPVSWHDHVDGEFNISDRWLSRVQEVVDWAIERDMYVIVNIHHDCEKSYYYPSYECLENSQKYVSAIWSQLSARFIDYNEHLIFENLNEPRLKDTPYEWMSGSTAKEVTESMECINALNQTFVNTVRASGGKNAERYLMVSGYDAAVAGVITDRFVLPEDSTENRLIISTHAYIPYDFALQSPKESGSRSEWSIQSAGDKSYIAGEFESLYKEFVLNGIPVVMGEFGSRTKGNNVQARVDHAAYYVLSGASRGIPCLWWDNNAFKGNGELFGLIHRSTMRWEYPKIVEAMMQYKLK